MSRPKPPCAICGIVIKSGKARVVVQDMTNGGMNAAQQRLCSFHRDCWQQVAIALEAMRKG